MGATGFASVLYSWTGKATGTLQFNFDDPLVVGRNHHSNDGAGELLDNKSVDRFKENRVFAANQALTESPDEVLRAEHSTRHQ